MTRRKERPPTPQDELRRDLTSLKLDTMLAHLDVALEEAATLEQGYSTFLAGLVGREVLARAEAGAARRIDAGKFPMTRTFDTFDWAFQPGLNVAQVKELQSLRFVEQGRSVLLLGKPGTGKTHLSIAFGVLAAHRGYTVRFYTAPALLSELLASLADNTTDRLVKRLARIDVLIIDDLRPVPQRAEYASLLFDLIEARYLRRPTILSSNVSVEKWGEILGNPALTAAMVDRLMEKAHVINIRKGRSYRTEGPDASPERPSPESAE